MSFLNKSARLTIFEGPDCSGKSTAARDYAQRTGAHYVHSGAFKGVGNIGRFYVEAMMPALLGHRDVVMDRAWLSEMPYGIVFRQGADRLGFEKRRALDRLAARCATVVVLCEPPIEAMEATFRARRKEEMLTSVDELHRVAAVYKLVPLTDLPTVTYDYTTDPKMGSSNTVLHNAERLRTEPHKLGDPSAGFMNAPVVLVGEQFAAHKEGDPLYQWPFGSLSGAGCSRWLAQHLEQQGIPESRLRWVNALDCSSYQDLKRICDGAELVVALGREAEHALQDVGVEHGSVPHPQFWKRFHLSAPYPLGDMIHAHWA